MVFADGSGLSHDNRTTAAAIVTALRHMHGHPAGEMYRNSLAIPGEEVGTLRRRMKDLEANVRAKTGTIRGVSTLSGYVQGPRGRWYAFSVLCNDTHKAKGGADAARRLQDGLCRTLATWGAKTEALGG
jgi:D-alanyl-D-alanine carboxypeptidase/D-alanyl-D-alanine-endopeptidase (penicillin-binding protein 4)